jgi:hypothetical protein
MTSRAAAAERGKEKLGNKQDHRKRKRESVRIADLLPGRFEKVRGS